MQQPLDGTADHHQQERNRKCDADQPPVAKAADNADAGGEPYAGGAGQAFDLVLVGMNDDASAEKADAGENTLDNAAACVRQLAGFNRGGTGDQHDQRGGQADETERAQADRLAVQITVEADGARGERRYAEPQDDVPPFEQVAISAGLARYDFGTRPII